MGKNLIFHQLFEEKSWTYTYLLADTGSKEAVLIDPVLETVDRDLKLIHELGLTLKYVLDTHVHADHVTGAGEIRKRTGARTGVAATAKVDCVDLNLKEGDQIKFGSFSIQVLETPGHTEASLSFVCEGMVFTGDALLIRGCGRTDFQGGSSDKLFESVTGKLFRLPPETKVYPGHDYRGFTMSTIGTEMLHNPRLGQGKTREQFKEIMANLNLPYPKMIDQALPANQSCGQIAPSNPSAESPAVAVTTCESWRTGAPSGAILVDVRNADEFQGELGHIEGARLATLGEDLKRFLAGVDRSTSLVFVCRSGRRSEEAARTAMQMGFANVANLEGGMIRWNACGFPVRK